MVPYFPKYHFADSMQLASQKAFVVESSGILFIGFHLNAPERENKLGNFEVGRLENNLYDGLQEIALY